MKKTIGLISLLALSITNSFAGVVNYSKLSENEQEFIISNLDNSLIKYDASTDEVVIDKELEKQLREAGILSTQDSIGSGTCRGGGGGGA
jgi:flagellar biosynthesis/type III secretory pathway M-ring protein FliF/YscJ